MATSDFLPLAVGAGANVETQAAYAAETALLENGFQAGVAPSAKFNKALRQSTIMAAVLAKWIADKSGANSVDDGTIATLVSNLTAAVSSLASVVDASTTVKGKVQLATAAESWALSDALKAISPATLDSAFKGSNQSFAASGYQKLPGGLIIQWGKTASLAYTVATAISYPIAFPSTVLAGFVESETPSSGVSGNTYFAYTSLSQFTTANPDSASRVYRWVAIGY